MGILENIKLLKDIPNKKKVSATIFKEHIKYTDEIINDAKEKANQIIDEAVNESGKAKEQTDVPIYSNAKKPHANTLIRACIDFNIEPKKVAMVGDRPLSDILGGKNAGMVTILVDSISKDDENFLVRFVRFLERLTIKK